MKNLFKVLGFIITWVFSFVVIYLQHIAFVEGGKEVDMFGLLLLIAIALGFIRWVENKIKVWEIQDKHKVFILNWKSGKRILLIAMFTWVLFTIEDDLPKMQVTALMITSCFVVGYIFNLLGNLPKRIKKEAT